MLSVHRHMWRLMKSLFAVGTEALREFFIISQQRKLFILIEFRFVCLFPSAQLSVQTCGNEKCLKIDYAFNSILVWIFGSKSLLKILLYVKIQRYSLLLRLLNTYKRLINQNVFLCFLLSSLNTMVVQIKGLISSFLLRSY